VKNHKFKPTATGQCGYIAGSEEGARHCGALAPDPLHRVPMAPDALASGIAKAFSGLHGPRINPEEAPSLTAAEAAWQVHSTMVADLLATKQAYGDAWVDQGYMGNIARILSKTSRIKNMCWQDNDFVGGGSAEGEESVLDTLKDLSALCAFAIANIEDGNRWGQK
jgi:hypothetical protein